MRLPLLMSTYFTCPFAQLRRTVADSCSINQPFGRTVTERSVRHLDGSRRPRATWDPVVDGQDMGWVLQSHQPKFARQGLSSRGAKALAARENSGLSSLLSEQVDDAGEDIRHRRCGRHDAPAYSRKGARLK
jgi:hypothetical protein